MAVGAAALAGCGNENEAGAGSGTGDVAAAENAVAHYTGKPTAFPVDTPLKAKPAGKTFAYLQCSTPACALFAQMLEPTQELLGYELKVVKAGPSANEVQSAMDSIVSLKPDGVILPAADPNQFLQQLEQLQDAEIPISANGIVDPEKYGLEVDFINNDTDELAGKLMADWAVAHGGGEVVFYGVPELSFTPIMEKAFDDEMAAVCPSCEVRHVDIPVGEIGKTAPSAGRLRSPVAPEHEGRGVRHGRGRDGPAGRAQGGAAEGRADGLGPAAGDPRLHQAGPVGRGARRRCVHDDLGPGRRAGTDGVR